MSTLKQILHFNKSTKGTHQFTADVPETAVTTSIYIRKDAMPVPAKEIVVTIEVVE